MPSLGAGGDQEATATLEKGMGSWVCLDTGQPFRSRDFQPPCEASRQSDSLGIELKHNLIAKVLLSKQQAAEQAIAAILDDWDSGALSDILRLYPAPYKGNCGSESLTALARRH